MKLKMIVIPLLALLLAQYVLILFTDSLTYKIIATGVSLLTCAALAYIALTYIRRSEAAFKKEAKRLDEKSGFRGEMLEIVNAVASQTEVVKILRELLPKLNISTRSLCSAFYTVNNATGRLEIRHSVGFGRNLYNEFDISLGEGMVGQAVIKKDITIYADIPEDTVYMVRTFLGKIKPRSLMIVPIVIEDKPVAALVCASIYDYTPDELEVIELIRHYLGVAVKNGANFEKNKRLANELEFQNRLIQDQFEDMKKRLDERTALFNTLFNRMGTGCRFALDARGNVFIWGKGAEQTFKVSARAAAGKQIDRICEDGGWPLLSKSFKEAEREGKYNEFFFKHDQEGKTHGYNLEMRCLRNDENEPCGFSVTIKEENA